MGAAYSDVPMPLVSAAARLHYFFLKLLKYVHYTGIFGRTLVYAVNTRRNPNPKYENGF